MGRHKTISDDDVLIIARELFRAGGHTVTTRQIAEAAGISEAILYQRFGSKDRLFFAAMHPRGPDIEKVLGPEDPGDDALAYLRSLVLRLGQVFVDVIPLALRVMTHPSFEPGSLTRAQPSAAAMLQEGLTKRLKVLTKRKLLEMESAEVTARLLVSLAHDWALRNALSAGVSPHRDRELKAMVDIMWRGLRPR